MKAIDALKEALNSSGIPVTHIGLKLGRRPNYVSGIATRGSTPQADTLASMLSVCGYVLAALPLGKTKAVVPTPNRVQGRTTKRMKHSILLFCKALALMTADVRRARM